jgi:acyl-homoserine lactone acylase PvdQ
VQQLYSLGEQGSNSRFADPFDKGTATGSNAFAIGPGRSASGYPLLYINPHVSFYFRTEMHVSSEEGLNAYGAVTWGQFFVYQGFNEQCGWMHTSSQADAADLYTEKIIRRNDSLFYEYDGRVLPVTSRPVMLSYGKGGNMITKELVTWQTHHGPVVGARNGSWLSLKEKNRSVNGLVQSWLRTKAKNFEDFRAVMQMRTNSSTNTMYADRAGNIAYWHGNFIPKRNPGYNWAQPVDGSLASTEWMDAHDTSETVSMDQPVRGMAAELQFLTL